jgi:Flp pilus assembly protein TadB
VTNLNVISRHGQKSRKKKLQESHCKLRIIKKQQKIENRRLKTKTELTVRNNQKPRSNRQKKIWKKICVAKCLWIKEPVCLLACKALSRTLCILFLSTVSTLKKKRLAIFYHLFPCFLCVCVYANQVFITITSSLSISFSRIPVIFLAVICFTRKIQKTKKKKRLNKFRLVISLSFGIFLFHVIFIFPQKNKLKKKSVF